MMLRLQTERMAGTETPSQREYFNLFGLDSGKLMRAAPNALVMHPGPMNRGVEIDSGTADDVEKSPNPYAGGNGGCRPHGLPRGFDCEITMNAARFLNAHLFDPSQSIDGIGYMDVAGGMIKAINLGLRQRQQNREGY